MASEHKSNGRPSKSNGSPSDTAPQQPLLNVAGLPEQSDRYQGGFVPSAYVIVTQSLLIRSKKTVIGPDGELIEGLSKKAIKALPVQGKDVIFPPFSDKDRATQELIAQQNGHSHSGSDKAAKANGAATSGQSSHPDIATKPQGGFSDSLLPPPHLSQSTTNGKHTKQLSQNGHVPNSRHARTDMQLTQASLNGDGATGDKSKRWQGVCTRGDLPQEHTRSALLRPTNGGHQGRA